MVPVSDLARADISRGLEKILGQLATPALLEGVIARASYYLTCRALHTTHRQDREL
jgi:hypothetical protein